MSKFSLLNMMRDHHEEPLTKQRGNELFKAISRYLRSEMTIHEIHKAWEDSQYGREMNHKNFRTWLKGGCPRTRNIYFEPFLFLLAFELLLEKKYRAHEEWEDERWRDPVKWYEQDTNSMS